MVLPDRLRHCTEKLLDIYLGILLGPLLTFSMLEFVSSMPTMRPGCLWNFPKRDLLDGVSHALIKNHTVRVQGEEVVGHRVALKKSNQGFRVKTTPDDVELGELRRKPIAPEEVQSDKYRQTIASLTFSPELLLVDSLQALYDLPRTHARQISPEDVLHIPSEITEEDDVRSAFRPATMRGQVNRDARRLPGGQENLELVRGKNERRSRNFDTGSSRKVSALFHLEPKSSATLSQFTTFHHAAM